jgi:pimeloyl-ACP methyl ester carboxylesterase
MKVWILIVSLLLASLARAASVPEFYGQSQQAKVNDAVFSYYRFGSGKPLVMVTGHGDNMNMWDPILLKELSQRHTIIIFDYPGIGASTEKKYPNSFAQLSTLIQAFIKTQALTKPDILGFSMGGSLVLYMATQYSGGYDHVIVIGAKAGGKKTTQPDPKYFNMLKDPNVPLAVAIKTLLFPSTADKEADAYLKDISQVPPEKMDGAALKAQAEAVTAENNGDGIWDQLSNIKNKLLVINGTEDLLTPVQNATLIASAVPGAWLVQVEGAGHGVMFQKPEFSGKLIELFLDNY